MEAQQRDAKADPNFSTSCQQILEGGTVVEKQWDLVSQLKGRGGRCEQSL